MAHDRLLLKDSIGEPANFTLQLDFACRPPRRIRGRGRCLPLGSSMRHFWLALASFASDRASWGACPSARPGDRVLTITDGRPNMPAIFAET